jgi:hypothetical protein
LRILEDAILIASRNGEPFRDVVVVLGDIDLSLTEHVFDVPVDSTTTHWWLIGHKGGNVVYSSTLNLNGIDMYDVEPYIGAELAWNIPNNLDGFVNETGFSFDWWAQTLVRQAQLGASYRVPCLSSWAGSPHRVKLNQQPVPSVARLSEPEFRRTTVVKRTQGTL